MTRTAKLIADFNAAADGFRRVCQSESVEELRLAAARALEAAELCAVLEKTNNPREARRWRQNFDQWIATTHRAIGALNAALAEA